MYKRRHDHRKEVYKHAIDEIKGQASWAQLFAPIDKDDPDAEAKRREMAEMQASLLKPLSDREDHNLNLPEGVLTCATCGASLSQMASDLAAANALLSDVLVRVQQLTAPEEKIERVRVVEVTGMGQALSTPEDVDQLLEQLRNHLLKLIASGSKVILE